MRISALKTQKYFNNESYIENILKVSCENERIRIENVLAKYGNCKWWLSDSAIVRLVGQLNEKNMIMPFEEFHKDLQSVVGNNIRFGKLSVFNYAFNVDLMLDVLKEDIYMQNAREGLIEDVEEVKQRLKELNKDNVLDIQLEEKKESLLEIEEEKEGVLDMSKFILLTSDYKGAECVKVIEKIRNSKREEVCNSDKISEYYYENATKSVDSVLLTVDFDQMESTNVH